MEKAREKLSELLLKADTIRDKKDWILEEEEMDVKAKITEA